MFLLVEGLFQLIELNNERKWLGVVGVLLRWWTDKARVYGIQMVLILNTKLGVSH